MRLQRALLYVKKPTDQINRLGQTVYEEAFLTEGKGRFANWSVQEIGLLDRKMTQTQQKVLTNLPFAMANQAEWVVIGNSPKLKIKEVMQVGRWVVLYAERWRT